MKIKIHRSVTFDRVITDLADPRSLENPGICLACGDDAECTPDARRYVCESCGARAVYGCEEILLMGVAHGSGKSERDRAADRVDGYDRDDLGESPD